MAEHIAIEELADIDAGLLDDDRRAVVEDHLSGCSTCRGRIEALRQVSARLSAEPSPPMPADVFARLQASLRQESGYRVAGVSSLAERRASSPAYAAYRARPSLGRFGADRPRTDRRRWVVPALAAAAAATLVGFGGYVLSASAGLNEPPPVAASVDSRDLSTDARALERSANLDPHRFSRAWRCARGVTDGRIVALASTTVDGRPALLVYTREDGVTSVAVVTGCESGRAEAGPTARLGG